MSDKGNWIGGVDGFDKRCMELAIDVKLFKNFKRDKEFIRVIGNDIRPLQIAEKIYAFLENEYPQLISEKNIAKFSENDELGNPIIHSFNNVKISAGTLIFMLHLYNIISHLGEKFNVITEIGSGYGGQALVIKKYLEVKEYHCIDRDGALHLCDTYLGNFFEDGVYFHKEPFEWDSDLLISNYCLNEMNYQGIDQYADTLIKNAKYLYLAVSNFDEDKNPYNKYLLETLQDTHHINIYPENPLITKHKNYYIIGERL